MRMILAAALLALAACGKEQPEGTRLTVTVAGEASDLASGLAARLAAEASSRTLIAQGPGGETLPGLASSWRFVDDGRSLILRLRPVQWSDDKPLEAKQVVASLRRAAGRGAPALLAAGIRNAESIAAGDQPTAKLGALAPIARVVELRLDAASPLLLGWLAEPALAITRTGKPATLAAYDLAGPPERHILKRRTMAAAPDARPAEIVIATLPDVSAAIAGFAAGKSHIVIGEGLAGLGEARAVPPREALRLDALWGVYGYRANTGKGPLADPATRRALSLAIDRQALAASFGLSAIAAAEGLVPVSLGLGNVSTLGLGQVSGLAPPFGDAAARLAKARGRATAAETGLLPAQPAAGLDPETRLAESRRLLSAAGWNAERPLRLLLLVPPGRDHRRVAERVAADWAQIDVQLVISPLAVPALTTQIAKGEFDLAVEATSVPVPDAAALLARYRCSAGRFCNPAADALLDAARVAGPAARAVLLARAEAELMAAPPLIPLFTPVRWALVARKVDGWTSNPGGRHPLGRLAVK